MSHLIPNSVDGKMLDDEFELDLVLAHDLMKQMKLSEDRRVCARYINTCFRMKTENIDIKFHRNRFFRYLMRAMKRAVSAQRDYYFHLPEGMVGLENPEHKEVKQFSADRRTYISAKVIPGYATLIYMAVTNDPEEWSHDGFMKLATYVPDMAGHVEKLIKKREENRRDEAAANVTE